MKKAYSLLLTLALIGAIFTTGCKKKTDDPTRKDFIKKTWKVTKAEKTAPAPTQTLYQDPLPAGQSNIENYASYRITFTNDTDYSYTSIQNTPSTGTWAFGNGDNSVSFTAGGLAGVTFTIETLTADSFVINYSENNPKTGNRTVRLTMVPVQ